MDGRAAVLLNGGIYSGLEVAKAQACGADAVMIGKEWPFALASAGEAGVARLLAIMRDELATIHILSGGEAGFSRSREDASLQSAGSGESGRGA